VLVLPSHNEPFHGLHARLGALIAEHEERLTRMRQALAARKRAVDLFDVLFRRRVSPEMLIFATGESIAHLNCLIARKQASGEVDASGVVWYRRI